MGFSPLADVRNRIPDVGRSTPRKGRISGVLIHHNAGVDAYGEATRSGRHVSANYWITNAGRLLPNIDETRRAWTTGSAFYPAGAAADERFITVEVSNSLSGVRSGTYAISAAARVTLERLIADVFRRYGLGRVHRGTKSGVAVHQDFVPTQCPGPYIMANLAGIISNAETIRVGKRTQPKRGKEIKVKHYHRSDKFTRGRGVRVLEPGHGLYLNERNGVSSQATNIVGGAGQYSITPHVYASGEPGDAIDVVLVWQNTKAKPVRNSPHFRQRFVLDKTGQLFGNVEFKRAVEAGFAVYVRVETPATNVKPVTVTLLASDAHLYKAV